MLELSRCLAMLLRLAMSTNWSYFLLFVSSLEWKKVKTPFCCLSNS